MKLALLIFLFCGFSAFAFETEEVDRSAQQYVDQLNQQQQAETLERLVEKVSPIFRRHTGYGVVGQATQVYRGGMIYYVQLANGENCRFERAGVFERDLKTNAQKDGYGFFCEANGQPTHAFRDWVVWPGYRRR